MENNRQKELLALLAQAQEEVMNGNEVSTEFARVLFPPARKEYELTYYGKEPSLVKLLPYPYKKIEGLEMLLKVVG